MRLYVSRSKRARGAPRVYIKMKTMKNKQKQRREGGGWVENDGDVISGSGEDRQRMTPIKPAVRNQRSQGDYSTIIRRASCQKCHDSRQSNILKGGITSGVSIYPNTLVV